MTYQIAELISFVAVAVVVGVLGVGLGILVLAPRLSRLADHNDEEPGARSD